MAILNNGKLAVTFKGMLSGLCIDKFGLSKQEVSRFDYNALITMTDNIRNFVVSDKQTRKENLWITSVLCPCLERFGLVQINEDYYYNLLLNNYTQLLENKEVVINNINSSFVDKIIFKISKDNKNDFYPMYYGDISIGEIQVYLSENNNKYTNLRFYIDNLLSCFKTLIKKDNDKFNKLQKISKTRPLNDKYISIYDISNSISYQSNLSDLLFERTSLNIISFEPDVINRFILDHICLFDERYMKYMFNKNLQKSFKTYYILYNVFSKLISMEDKLQTYIELYFDDLNIIINEIFSEYNKDIILYKTFNNKLNLLLDNFKTYIKNKTISIV